MLLKILVAYDDPGGGLAVSSVVRRIAETRDADLSVYSGKPSLKFLKDTGFNINELKSDLTFEEASAIIEREVPDILLTATGGGSAEQQLRNVAHKRNISSFVVLDFWKHYARRWIYADYDIANMKDVVFVMDENAKIEMLSEGFPENQIVVTGHPYLEQLFSEDNYVANSRAGWNSCLFLSQPSDTIGLKDYKKHPVSDLIKELKKHSKSVGKELLLYVKLHPLETLSEELLKIVVDSDEIGVRVFLMGAEYHLNDLLKNCRTVIGYNSVALFEAASRGKRVFSLDIVPMNDSLKNAMTGAGIEIVRPRKIAERLADKKANRKSGYQGLYSGATENCINRMFSA